MGDISLGMLIDFGLNYGRDHQEVQFKVLRLMRWLECLHEALFSRCIAAKAFRPGVALK